MTANGTHKGNGNGAHRNGNGTHNGNGNGNGRSVGKTIGAESAAFAAAEGVSMVTSMGVIALADQLIPPSMLKSATSAISKVCILPFLEPIEKAMSSVCKLEECQPDTTRSREERAQELTRTLLIFGAAWYASMRAKIFTRRFLNGKMGIVEELPKKLPKDATMLNKIMHEVLLWRKWSPQERLIIAADEGVHYGSLLLMNTGAAQYTDDMIQATTSMLQKVGVNKYKAHQLATMAWVWEAPNLLGMVAGIGAIAGKHKLGWKLGSLPHVEQLAKKANSEPVAPAHP